MISLLMNLSLSFALTLILFPILLATYIVLSQIRKVWIRFIKWKYPKNKNYVIVEETTIRSILDRGRNHGICTLLVQGRSIAKGVRDHLENLAATKQFLKSYLLLQWGIYIWKKVDYFSIDDHLVNRPCFFRGRPINEKNIQDYVSDITSKYLPNEIPPWQVHIMEYFMRGEKHQVCLVRAHHLLLRQERMTLADFLPLKYSTNRWICKKSDSPFTNLYVKPSALPRLGQMFIKNFSNYWNNFLYNNDPIERPKILKKDIGIFYCVKITVIVFVCMFKELISQRSEGLKLMELFRRESRKRNFNLQLIFNSIVKSLNPITIIYSSIFLFWNIMMILFLKLPLLFGREMQVLKSQYKHYYPNSLTYKLSCYFPLMFQALREAMSISWIIVTAPKVIIEELLLRHPPNEQISTCGRKVVSWSDKVDMELVRKIAGMSGATETEILLAATVDALKEYFRYEKMSISNDVFATMKYMNQQAVFRWNKETQGIFCLSLPIQTPLFHDDLIGILQIIQRNIQEARGTFNKQRAIYAITAAELSSGVISSCMPSLVLKLFLNQLSRKYSLCLTHVDGDLPMEDVDTVMYWRPPQGNCNMSMTLHRRGNEVRLGVMADALIGPGHFIISKTFPKSIRKLANILGVPGTLSRSPSPNPLNPTTSPGY